MSEQLEIDRFESEGAPPRPSADELETIGGDQTAYQRTEQPVAESRREEA